MFSAVLHEHSCLLPWFVSCKPSFQVTNFHTLHHTSFILLICFLSYYRVHIGYQLTIPMFNHPIILSTYPNLAHLKIILSTFLADVTHLLDALSISSFLTPYHHPTRTVEVRQFTSTYSTCHSKYALGKKKSLADFIIHLLSYLFVPSIQFLPSIL